MDEHRFDDLLRDWTETTGSRRRVLTLAAGSALASLLGRFGLEATAARCGKPGTKCDRAGDCCKGSLCKRGTCACPPSQKLVAGFCASAFGREGSGQGQLDFPTGVAVDARGLVSVADRDNHRIQVFTPTGKVIRTWGRQGAANGEFDGPTGVAADRDGNVYVADTGNDRIQKFDGDGNHLLTWGDSGFGNGQFSFPSGVAVDRNGNVYVADTENDRIQRFTGNGLFLAAFGRRGGAAGEFDVPSSVAVDDRSNVYVMDLGNSRVQVFDVDGAFVRAWGSEGAGDGQFDLPHGIPVDRAPSGRQRVYVADGLNHRIQQFSGDGDFLRAWGRNGDGVGEFDFPVGVAVDRNGVVYAIDQSNDRVQRFDPV